MRHFGTDGIRGKAGEGVLRPERTALMGRAIGAVLRENGVRSCLVARDTRISGPMIECALVSGLSAEGLGVARAGVITTPGAHAAAVALGAEAAAVVSASHNPAADNGIKVMLRDGLKIPEEMEKAIEELYDAGASSFPYVPSRPPGGVSDAEGAMEAYIRSMMDRIGPGFRLRGIKVVLDCANGAGARSAPEIFRRLGAEVVETACNPDGLNINLGCGALHPEGMADMVRNSGAFFGAALDGDGDRLIAADEKGGILDGDQILAVLARSMKAGGRLPGSAVAATIMSNAGLSLSLAGAGISLRRTDVGDRNVAAAMKALGLALGGEQSGHIMFGGPEGPLPGDGTVAALAFLKSVVESGRSASEAAGCITLLPQALVNVPVGRKTPFREIDGLLEVVSEVETELASRGRVLLRYSGTENVARILVEGADPRAVREHAQRIAAAFEKAR